MFKPHWHNRFLNLAETISHWSKDPSTKCGAIIVDDYGTVISQGYNGFPRGMDDTDEKYNDREYKYDHVIHAEMNAVINARQAIDDHIVYVWPMLPCIRCTVVLAQSHIKCIVSQKLPKNLEERWGESVRKSKAVFEEVGIEVIEIEEDQIP
jgi:dCMP deaminase